MPKIQTRSSLQRLQFFAVADTAASTRLRLSYGEASRFSSCIVASFATYDWLWRAKSGL